MHSNLPFSATSSTTYHCGDDVIVVEIGDSISGLRWRMCVNGHWSHVRRAYADILTFKGYSVASPYWEGFVKEFVPFKIIYASRGEPREE